MICPNCAHTTFQILSALEPFQQCLRCGWMVCARCAGNDTSCNYCDGEGAFAPEVEE